MTNCTECVFFRPHPDWEVDWYWEMGFCSNQMLLRFPDWEIARDEGYCPGFIRKR